MSLQADLVALLKVRCPRVFTDVASLNTPRPYVTFQFIGGRSLRWLDGAASDKRQTRVQVNVWADTRAACTTLIQQIEDDLAAATDFHATVESEPINTVETDIEPTRYGATQDFLIYSAR